MSNSNKSNTATAFIANALIACSLLTSFYPRNETTTAAQLSVGIKVKNKLLEKGLTFESISFRNVQEKHQDAVIIVHGIRKNGKCVDTSFTVSIPGREDDTEVPITFNPTRDNADNHIEPISSYVMVTFAAVIDMLDNKDVLHTFRDEVFEKLNECKFGTISDMVETENGFKVMFSEYVVSKKNSAIYKKMANSVEGYTFSESFMIRDVLFNILHWCDDSHEEVAVVNRITFSDIIAEELRLADTANTYENDLKTQLSVMEDKFNALECSQAILQEEVSAGEIRNNSLQNEVVIAEAGRARAEAQCAFMTHNMLYGIASQQAMFVAMQNNTRLVNSVWNPAMLWWEFTQENGGRFVIGTAPPQPMYQQPPINWAGQYESNGMMYYHPPEE